MWQKSRNWVAKFGPALVLALGRVLRDIRAGRENQLYAGN